MFAGQDHIDMNIARLQKTLEKTSAVPNYEIFEDQSDTVRKHFLIFSDIFFFTKHNIETFFTRAGSLRMRRLGENNDMVL